MKRASRAACALTLGNLVCGFAAIILAAKAYAETSFFRPIPADAVHAAWLLLLGMVFDGLDGRVARMAKADTAFGAQLDSLADVVSFGLAPAVLAWVVGARAGIPESLLWAAGSLYAVAAALRLARYNVSHMSPRKATKAGNSDFEGLPSPAAAGLVAAFLILAEFVAQQDPHDGIHLLQLLPWTVIAGGLLMVSRIPYLHVLNRLGKLPSSFKTMAAVTLLAGFLLYPHQTLASVFGAYALGGLARGLVLRLLPPGEDDEEAELAEDRLPRR